MCEGESEMAVVGLRGCVEGRGRRAGRLWAAAGWESGRDEMRCGDQCVEIFACLRVLDSLTGIAFL